MNTISPKDLAVLRKLANRLAEIGNLPEMEEKAELWRRLNRLERVRPMILLQNGTWHETSDLIIKLECEGEDARNEEFGMRGWIWHYENVHDDMVYDKTVWSPVYINTTGWEVTTDATVPDHVFGARHYNAVLKGDENPAEKIKMPVVSIDEKATEERYKWLCRIWDGILPIKKRGTTGFWFAIMDQFIQWRGLDNTFIDMVDRPEWVHAWLNRMTEWHVSSLEQTEKLGLLSLNNGDNGACSIGPGGVGITELLPQKDYDGVHVRTKDMWAHATTQIFSEVSPAMQDEFALKYESRFLSKFGFASYGCCEPLHNKINLIRKRLPNVRRISISPWADVETSASAMRNELIFSYKPNPAILGMETFDEDYIRNQLKNVFEITKDCVVEALMKDLHTVAKEPQRMGKWVKIALEVAQEYD